MAGYVVTDVPWTSGVATTYDLPDGLDVGTYYYTITFVDDYGNHINDNLVFSIYDTIYPIFVETPDDRILEAGYSGQSVYWNVTDASPSYFIVELIGTGIVQTATAWESGVNAYFNIPDGLGPGEYYYRANFTDQGVNKISDTVKITVEDTTSPVIMTHSGDISITVGYADTTIYWVYFDAFPGTYTIELVGSGVVVGPISWVSEAPINYIIPDDLAAGVYVFNITVTDSSGNSASATITVTVNNPTGGEIPLGNYFFLFLGISIICLLIATKYKKIRKL
jgi:hypothetical protein